MTSAELLDLSPSRAHLVAAEYVDGPGHREPDLIDDALPDDEWHYALGAGAARTYPRTSKES